MAKTFLLALIIVASFSIASAQDDYKRWEIFGGYSQNRIEGAGDADFDPTTGEFNSKHAGFHGFNASATRNFSRYFGAKGDISGHYRNKTTSFASFERGVVIKSSLYNFLLGAQVKDNSTESFFKPFGHALAGVAFSRDRFKPSPNVCIAIALNPCSAPLSSNNGFAAALGGGLDIRTSKRIDVRAIQIDYNPSKTGATTQDNLRIGVGIVIH